MVKKAIEKPKIHKDKFSIFLTPHNSDTGLEGFVESVLQNK